jgi:hypothetical protein
MLSVGLEGSAEIERPYYLLRLWYARDFSVPFAQLLAGHRSVTSARLGGDGVIKGPRLAFIGYAVHLSFLIFGYYEDIEFNDSAKNAPRFDLLYRTAYAGGGLSLSW